MAPRASARPATLQRLLYAAAVGDGDAVAALVTDDVTGWSPTLFVTSRAQLRASLEPRDEAFSRVELSISGIDQVGDKVIAEWHVAVDHTGPFPVDDELVVPATGRRVHLSGATVAEFDGEQVCAFRSYFDHLSLAEQVLADT